MRDSPPRRRRRSGSAARARALGLALAAPALAAAPARADDFALALGRLRVAAVDGPGSACPVTQADPVTGSPLLPRAYCPDGAAWRRLASELAVVAAGVPAAGADSGGLARFEVELVAQVTGVDAGGVWRRAVSDGAPGDPTATADGVPAALVTPRLRLRKGLPLGLSAEVELGRVAVDAPWWVWGAAVAWAPFEGFRSGWGALPDVAVRVGVTTLTGEPNLSLVVPSVALVLSKPTPVARAVVLTPTLTAELLLPRATSGVVDLTPDVDALAECVPDPEGGPGCDPTTPPPSGGRLPGEDLRNDAAFPRLETGRLRLVVALTAARGPFVARAGVAFDLVRPGAFPGTADDVTRQWTVLAAAGVRYE